MRPYISKTLDTARLMSLGDLDVRGMAAACKHLTAHDYFSEVERWIENAPQTLERLQNNPSPEELNSFRDTLRYIGHRTLPAELEAALYNVKKGQSALAAQRLAGITAGCSELYERLKTAYTPKKRGGSDSTEANPDSMLLIEALDHLDHEEAHRKLRILAVDDVSVVLNAVTSILSPHYEVFALTKASLVENFLKQHTPELFLLDIEMPELNGYDLLAVIRSFEAHKNTPIIFLTGSATIENLKTAVALGASDFISKPIDRDVLLRKIESKIVWKKAF